MGPSITSAIVPAIGAFIVREPFGSLRSSVVPNPPEGAEFGRPQWVFGTSTWASAGPSRLVVSYARKGQWHLATVNPVTGALTDIAPQLVPHDWMAANGTHAVVIAGSATQPDAVVRIDLTSGAVETLRRGSALQIDAGYISAAEPVEFDTTNGERGARVLLRAAQQGFRGARRRAAAAHRHQPRRPDVCGPADARFAGPVPGRAAGSRLRT